MDLDALLRNSGHPALEIEGSSIIDGDKQYERKFGSRRSSFVSGASLRRNSAAFTPETNSDKIGLDFELVRRPNLAYWSQAESLFASFKQKPIRSRRRSSYVFLSDEPNSKLEVSGSINYIQIPAATPTKDINLANPRRDGVKDDVVAWNEKEKSEEASERISDRTDQSEKLSNDAGTVKKTESVRRAVAASNTKPSSDHQSQQISRPPKAKAHQGSRHHDPPLTPSAALV